MVKPSSHEPAVITKSQGPLCALVLNRPRALNSLTLDMIRALRWGLEEALADPEVRLVALWGAGDKGFCAGGDIKVLTRLVRDRDFGRAEAFFREEYALDLLLHRSPKHVVVMADGIAMGGGLGLAVGADLVIATGRSRMAMPETKIGFFPDVGATGWLSAKCPSGYPEFLGLTGSEVKGPETVRLGLATHLAASQLPDIKEALRNCPVSPSAAKAEAVAHLRQYLSPLLSTEVPANPDLDRQVARHFAGKASVPEILASLSEGASQDTFCRKTLGALRQRSPTALVLTCRLLKENRSRPLEQVFASEWRAAKFMIRHPDYLEGVRARVIDKDDRPAWRPATPEEVHLNF